MEITVNGITYDSNHGETRTTYKLNGKLAFTVTDVIDSMSLVLVHNHSTGEFRELDTQKLTEEEIIQAMQMKNLILKNGTVAKFLYNDDFSRPVYEVTNNKRTFRVCCVNMDGTYLHTISASIGEPCSPLKDELQPSGEFA